MADEDVRSTFFRTALLRKETPVMDGTTLTTAHLGLLAGTILECIPEGITLEILDSWRQNKEETRKRMSFLAEMAPPPKRKGKKKVEIAMVNPAEFFVTSDAFYVDPDFGARIDLSPCADDAREPKLKFALPRNMNDSKIADQAGGIETLRATRATLPQLMRELRLALKGESKLFVKGNYYLLYLEGRDGDLDPVRVFWSGDQLRLRCDDFDERGDWFQGCQVCGN
jgi:hypothetical protein